MENILILDSEDAFIQSIKDGGGEYRLILSGGAYTRYTLKPKGDNVQGVAHFDEAKFSCSYEDLLDPEQFNFKRNIPLQCVIKIIKKRKS